MQVDFLKENAPETVVGTDYYKIIATACIAECKNTKIATLNSQMELKVYQMGVETLNYFANI